MGDEGRSEGVGVDAVEKQLQEAQVEVKHGAGLLLFEELRVVQQNAAQDVLAIELEEIELL